ncbi:MAG: hypothetical protein AAGH90_03075 [Pseudomonadota bacterium]
MRLTSFLIAATALGLGACDAGDAVKVGTMNPAVKPTFKEITISPLCAMPRASRSDHIVYAYSYGGGHKTPLAHAYKATGQGGEEYHVRQDIVVTRTDKPVYLVLDSYNAIMWNVVAAPGAKISGVSVTSYEGSSVAGVPERTKVGFLAFRGAPNTKCYNRDRTSKEWSTRWFPQTYGGRMDQGFNPSKDDGYITVVGPQPEQPYVMTPITAETVVHVPDTVHPAWGTREEVLAKFDAIAQAELDALLK